MVNKAYMEENFKYKDPKNGVVTEYRFGDGRFIGIFNDGEKSERSSIKIGTVLSSQFRKNLEVAGFKSYK